MKNFKLKKLTKPTATMLLTIGVLFGSGMVSSVEYESYIPQTQINVLSESFGCDLSYRQQSGLRLKHNGTEPIYVSFSKDFSEHEKQEIIRAFDYVFGIVGEINNNYKYQVVDSVKGSEYLNKSVIEIGVDETMEGSDGQQCANKFIGLSMLTGKGILSKGNKITFNPEFLKGESNRIYDVAIHELLHCFGLDDVYCDGESPYYSNTFINPVIEHYLDKITPNDYLMLLSMYPENFKSEQEKNDYIENVNKFIRQYSFEYYNAHIDARIDEYRRSGFFSEERLNNLFSPISENIELSFETGNNLNLTRFVNLVVKDGKYKISTYDKNMNIIDETTGDAFYMRDNIYLQDVQLDKFMQDKKSFADLVVYKDTISNNYGLHFLTGVDISSAGKEGSVFDYQEQKQ